MALILDADEQQRLQYWILEQFSPAAGPTRPDGAPEVRFLLGEFDLPGLPLSRWAVVRGLVWALREVAPDAWREIKALAQEAVDALLTQVVSPDAPSSRGIAEELDRQDLLFQAHAARLLTDAGLPLEMLGLRAEDEEIRASAREHQRLVVPNLIEFRAWQDRWHLAGDSSLFTVAILAAAASEADQFRLLSASNSALVTFASLFASVLPNANVVPVFEPSLAGSMEAMLAPPYPQAVHFEMPKFNPFVDTAATFKAAAKAAACEALERELDAHVKACLASLGTNEVTPVPVMRVPDAHFRWYIRFQILGQSLGQIAEAECATKGAVSLAVTDVANLAGVPKRGPNPSGRKKKTTPSASESSS